ncbi:BRO1 domain-containing protein BROX-like [Stegodyphus dumicola]|uniref:BRO1 domain-containing protein BROX-like n=1 Tax=Stegodyphus dumicola TaxID=202533 RepID=UPI0015ACB7EE|nr:BRO1 domain-containing protein BROX-like [Stegodyphus dumicola]
MAWWFHRNPLKATAKVNFELKLIANDSQAIQVCSELRQTRNRLLDLLTDPNHEADTLNTAFERYLSLLLGLIVSPDGKGESKLRYTTRFRWTQSLLGDIPLAQTDAVFELISISQNVGIWFMKHAAMIAGKDEINMDEAKEVHKCLRKAAGIFTTMQERYVGNLLQKCEPGSDLDSAVVNAYITQCTAEAQEKKALTSPEAEKWKLAMEEELENLKQNETWDFVPRPEERNVMKCKWVFKRKLNKDGQVERYKIRLVARYIQVEGIDDKETFSPPPVSLHEKTHRHLLAKEKPLWTSSVWERVEYLPR